MKHGAVVAHIIFFNFLYIFSCARRTLTAVSGLIRAEIRARQLQPCLFITHGETRAHRAGAIRSLRINKRSALVTQSVWAWECASRSTTNPPAASLFRDSGVEWRLRAAAYICTPTVNPAPFKQGDHVTRAGRSNYKPFWGRCQFPRSARTHGHARRDLDKKKTRCWIFGRWSSESWRRASCVE